MFPADRESHIPIHDHNDNTVSRNHCEVYAIVYEQDISHVYVRDRRSVNGTFVNGKLVGIGPDISPGYLLEDGDVIEIKPHWKFRFRHHSKKMEASLTDRQMQEAELFKNKYRLTGRCLGKGADASIYLAIDAVTTKQVVCKVVDLHSIRADGKHGLDREARLVQETKTLRKLQHPNILPYIDGFRSPRTLYTITELASGGDLMSFLFRYEQVKEFDARVIIRQVVEGLNFLHTQGIVHRDLKPENVLLAYSPRVAYHRVLLADFGASALPGRNRMVTVIGTRDYQAPECIGGRKHHSTAADIWSLGIIAQMLVAGDNHGTESLGMYSQMDVDKILQDSFKRRQPAPSDNAKMFTVACLRVSCNARMTVMEARDHDWLCKPESHLKYFRAHEQRMLVDWQSAAQLRPEPTELQSLRGSSDWLEPWGEELRQQPSSGRADESSEYFVKPDIPRHEKKPLTLSCKSALAMENTGVYDFFAQPTEREGCDDEISLVAMPSPVQPSPPSTRTTQDYNDGLTAHPNASRLPATQPIVPVGLAPADDSLSNTSKGAYPWSTVKKPQRSYKSSRKSQDKNKQISKSPEVINNHFATPHNNLDRHLPPMSGGPKREQVLDEMRRTNKTFLKNSETSSHALSPPESSTSRVEPNSKRRRTGPADNLPQQNIYC